MRRPPWRKTHMDGRDLLTDTERGVTVTALRPCETVLQNGSIQCVSLNSALSLCERATGVGVRVFSNMMRNTQMASLLGPTVTESTYDVRVTVVCPVCRARRLLSQLSCGWLTPLLLLKNLATLAVDGTSISWQMELRPTGATKSGAFPAWVASQTTETTRRWSSGPDMEVKSSELR